MSKQTKKKDKKISLKLKLVHILAAFEVFNTHPTPSNLPHQANLGPNSAFMCRFVESVLPPSAAENAV